jgi:large subunit ribosomal protein L22
MTGPKTNERPGTRATLRGYHMSASKARVVLNLIRGEDVNTAQDILSGTTREAADVIAKVLASAIANAVNNDGLQADELYVSAAYADEGITMKRFSPRARGRAGKILKRACHITVIVSRLDDERLEVVRSARSAQAATSRTRRVASSRHRADQQASLNKRESAAAAAAEAAEHETLENESIENEVTDEVETPVETQVVENDVVEDVVIVDEDEAAQDEAPTDAPEDETVSDDTTEEKK